MLVRWAEIGRSGAVFNYQRRPRGPNERWVDSLYRTVMRVARLFGVVMVRAKTMDLLEVRATQDLFEHSAYRRLLHISGDWDVSSVADYVSLSRSQL
jgi:hypothetical protein